MLSVLDYLKVAVVAGGVAGAAHQGDDLPLIHPVPHRNQYLLAVGIPGGHPVPVVDKDAFPVGPDGGIAGVDHFTIGGGKDVGPRVGGDVHAAVAVVAVVPRRDIPAIHRPEEAPGPMEVLPFRDDLRFRFRDDFGFRRGIRFLFRLRGRGFGDRGRFRRLLEN